MDGNLRVVVAFTPGDLVAGKFELVRPLAKGGMGAVWIALNHQLEIQVALKFMGETFLGSPDLVARFIREAKVAAQVGGPNVVQIYEYGVDREVPYIAMELLEGEDLSARLTKRGKLTLAETATIVDEVARALKKAHQQKLVHRDLKPANIFLCKHDDQETIKVLDFGIAKSLFAATAGDATKTGALLGSPQYMSPEQARKTNNVDARADLWSLGVIAYRALTGTLPFQGENFVEILMQVCTLDAPPPSSRARELGPDIDRYFARALSRDPDKRFQTAREMADALRTLAGLPPRERALDRSWNDSGSSPAYNGPLQTPLRGAPPTPPRDPQPQAPSPKVLVQATPIAQVRPPPKPPVAEIDDSDEVATVRIGDPKAQAALAQKPWKAREIPPTKRMLPSAFTERLPTSVNEAQPSAIGGLGAPRPEQGISPVAPLTPLPGAARDAQGHTITNAGTETLDIPLSLPENKSRSWITGAAIFAALLVVAVVGWVVVYNRESPAEETIAPLVPTQLLVPASAASPSSANTVSTGAVPAPALSATPSAAPSATPTQSATSSTSATAPKGTVPPPRSSASAGPSATFTTPTRKF